VATFVLVHGGGHGGWCYQRVSRLLRNAGHEVHTPTMTGLGERSLVDVAGPVIEMARPAGQVVNGVELVLLPSPDAGMFYGVTDPADLAWMAGRLTGHPWKCFGQKLDLRDEAGYAKIPQYHVVCTSTLATRDPVLMDEARAAGRLWDIDTGHDLMITEPQKVADALAAVAAG
jgi:hypothetical protein